MAKKSAPKFEFEKKIRPTWEECKAARQEFRTGRDSFNGTRDEWQRRLASAINDASDEAVNCGFDIDVEINELEKAKHIELGKFGEVLITIEKSEEYFDKASNSKKTKTRTRKWAIQKVDSEALDEIIERAELPDGSNLEAFLDSYDEYEESLK